MPSEVANGTPFNQKLHLISRSAQSAVPKFTSAKQVNLIVRLESVVNSCHELVVRVQEPKNGKSLAFGLDLQQSWV